MSRINPFPMDPDYWGAEAIPFIPVFVESPDDSAPADTSQPDHAHPPVPGDAGP